MIRQILLTLGDDPSSEAASGVALDLARRHQAAVTSLATIDTPGLAVATVAPGFGAVYTSFEALETLEQTARSHARTLVEHFRELARQAHVPSRGHLSEGTPWECVEIDSYHHDLLVVGHDLHLRFGSTPEDKAPGKSLRKILDTAACPVLCVAQAPLRARRVVVALDGKLMSARALQEFLRLGLLEEAAVTLLHCEHGGPAVDLDAVVRYVEAFGRSVEPRTVRGDPVQAIPETATALDADLVVLGAHGRSRLAEWLLGSTLLALLERTRRAILVGR